MKKSAIFCAHIVDFHRPGHIYQHPVLQLCTFLASYTGTSTYVAM